jgi:phage terminase large subunit
MIPSINLLPGLPRKQVLALLLQERARRQRLAEAAATAAAAQSSMDNPPELGPHSSLVLLPGHPYNDLQKDWLPSGIPIRYKIYYGGRDSAKSWSFAEELVRRTRDQPLRVLCTREYQNSIRDSVHHLLRATINRLGLAPWFNVTETSIKSRAGAEFIFRGLHNNVDEIKSTEAIDICWVAEAHYTSELSWQTLIPTIRRDLPDGRSSQIWIDFNVIDEGTPTHKRFVTNTPPGSIIHFINYDQNPYLSETSKREIEHLKEVDYAAYEHVYLGLPRKISDSVIYGGRYEVEAFPDDLWKQAQRLLFGLDFGFSQDPVALVRMFILEGCLYIEYEAWGLEIEFEGKRKFTPHQENLKHLPREEDGSLSPRGELAQLLDTVPGVRSWTIKADNSRPETISYLRGKGFTVEPAEKWQGCVEDGITHIKGFTRRVIHPRCVHTIQEGRLYSYKRDRLTGEVLPIIVDKHNHCWDGVRYGLDGYIQQSGDIGIWERLGRS